MKQVILAILVIFVAWSVLDFVIHGLILGSAYAGMPQMWRPMEEMKHILMYLVTLISAAAFVLVYSRLIGNKSMAAGLQFGLLMGVGYGIGMGYGSYAVMPLPYFMALTWFLGTIVEMTLAGALVALIVKETPAA